MINKAPFRENILVSLRKGAYPNAVYIGRPGIWGNPYTAKDGDAIDLYYAYLKNNKGLLERLSELENKQLACWCFPSRCHGDAIIQVMLEMNLSVLKMPIGINNDLI